MQQEQQSNIDKANKALRDFLTILAPFACRELKHAYGASWWTEGVLSAFGDKDYHDDLAKSGTDVERVVRLDMQKTLQVIDANWQDCFRKRLPAVCRSWCHELKAFRNTLAHGGMLDITTDDLCRGLDTIARLCIQIDSTKAERFNTLLREARYGSAEGSTAPKAAPADKGPAKAPVQGELSAVGLPAWRDVVAPHPDVAQGRYRNAEFAADLTQVAAGEGAAEYRDPVEFFARTYLTEGMSGLLAQSLQRLYGLGGEPVVQLKTVFGGGKTHSMLALYHLARATVPASRLPGVRDLLDKAGITELRPANVAVVVGTALDPTRRRRPADMPGVTVNTIWGEIAYQLAKSAGKPEAYEHVREADRKGVAPGSQALRQLFDDCGPCLVLMDELVAYAKRIKRIKDGDDLPAGSYDNFITFIQTITEAAKLSRAGLVVASIPESDIEIGGDAGKQALGAIEHTFGRVEAIWKPVTAGEGFEVVRRRLFLACGDEAARDRTCEAFARMYADNPGLFPVETRDADYLRRMKACYPIHPEVFDRLYEDWATLERFQRTRGVLRLMAAVVHELWMDGDKDAPLIMPGSLPLHMPAVRDELTRHLPDGWNALVDREIDGRHSAPYHLEKENPRYAPSQACRRLARAVMLGSAPSVRQQSVRGVETSRVRLGTVRPGEPLSVFDDALHTLHGSLSYLYANPNGDRHWFDTRPTLRKMVGERAEAMARADVLLEIGRRLGKLRSVPPLGGVHVCPGSSADVEDAQTVRLVVLGPDDAHSAGSGDSPALGAVRDILQSKGGAPRKYKNMLVFLAPDRALTENAEQAARRYLAWESVVREKDELNLDASQIKEAEGSLKGEDASLASRIVEAWRWLVVPVQPDPKEETALDVETLGSGDGDPVARAVRKLTDGEAVVGELGANILFTELKTRLWTDGDALRLETLWDYMTRYCYLQRLASWEVLAKTVAAGVASGEYFGYATAEDDGRYLELRLGEACRPERSGMLVRREVARRQKAEDARREDGTRGGDRPAVGGGMPGQASDGTGPNLGESSTGGYGGGRASRPRERPKTSFSMSKVLNNIRINKEFQQILEEIVGNLEAVDGAEIRLRLEVSAVAKGGIPADVVRTVTENCRTLRIEDGRFGE